ncbi:MAG: hypothetical protein IPN76_06395 [Saprospiraceae bacterium]|nr:hypothetical protein [Saprospiraceae bacterium]
MAIIPYREMTAICSASVQEGGVYCDPMGKTAASAIIRYRLCCATCLIVSLLLFFLLPASTFASVIENSPEICLDRPTFNNHVGRYASGSTLAPPVDVAFTCTGNAVFVSHERGITNTVFSLGAADDNFAQLYDTNDTLTLKLEEEVVSGSTVVVRWRKTGATNPIVTIAQSANSSSWTTPTSNTVTSTSFVNLSVTLTTNTRYLRFRNTNGADLQLDAVTYTSQTCNYTSGEGVPLSCSATTTSIAGTAFHDFNGNGTYESGSDYLGIQGINVTAVDSLGNSFSGTTSSTGAYSLTGLVTGRTYRVEFHIPTSLSWMYSSFRGINNGTTVQFVRPNSCANIGLVSPTDFCQSQPDLILPCYENGSGVGNTNPAVVTLPYNGSGITPAESMDFQTQQVGSVYGVAYDRRNKRAFVSSFLKRHSGFGPRGVDGVYVMDYSTATPTLLGGFDLQGITPANGGAAIDLGSITRTNIGDVNISAGAAGDYQLSSNRTRASVDLDAFGKAGIISYGDIDMSEDGRTLWMVNLNQRALITVDISNLGTMSSNPNTLSSTAVKQYPIASMTGAPTCTNGTLRPFALEFYKGKGYIGCVCDAATSSTLKKPAELDGYILSFNPTNPTTLTAEVSFGFDYNREASYSQLNPASGAVAGEWQRWLSTYNLANVNTGFANFQSAPQPLIADIEIVEDGDMVVGVMDRFAHQAGWDQYRAISADRTLTSGISTGDILKFGLSGGVYVAELGENDTKNTPAGFITNDSPGNGGEFFFGDYYTGFDASHCETALGGLTIKPGSNEVTVGSLDPLAFNSQGVTWMNLSTGAQNRIYQVTGGTNIANFGKGAALGDFEMMCDASPIEIGNYVWIDTDKDGVQDPGEAGLNGVNVNLYRFVSGTATLVATTTTATVNGQTGAYYFRDYQQYGTGFDTLSLNTQYYIVLGQTGGTYTWSTTNQNLTVGSTNYVLTSRNTGSGTTPDQNDNDAFSYTTSGQPFSNFPVDTVTIGNAGYVNHTLDFGLKICPTITNPSAAQTICVGGSGSNITVNTSTNAANSIRFVRFSTDQMAGSTPTAGEAAAIYAGSVIATVTPSGGASPYTATYTFNTSDFPSSGTTYYVYAILNPDEGAVCRPTQEITVTVNPAATANAGTAQTVCVGGTVTLAGSVGGSATSGTWTAPSGTFSNAGSLTSTYTPSITSGTVTLTLTTDDPAGPCPAATSTVVITVNPAATANAGTAQTVCAGGTVTLAGSVGGSATSGTWTAPSGTFSNAGSLTSTYTPSITSGTVTLTLTTNDPTGPCPAATSTVVITVNPAATANAGTAQTVCAGGTVTLAGSVGGGATSGTWTAPSGTFSNAGSLTSTYTPSITNGTVTLTLTTNDPAGPCPAATSTVVITVDPKPDFTLALATVCPGGNPEVTIGGLANGTPATSTMKINTGAFVPYVASPPNLTTAQGITINATNTVTVRNEHGCETAKNIAVPAVVPLVCPPVNLTKLPAGSD